MWLNFLYTVQLLISDVCTKFQNSRSSSSGEIFDENFQKNVGKKEKRTNKGTDKPYVADSFIHSKTCHT